MNSETADRTKPALALSGGGFRATLFHIGALQRVNELGYLAKFERVSSVSGGSIASGMLAAKWSKLQLDDGRFANLETQVIAPLRAFCRRSIDTLAVCWGALLTGKTNGDVLTDTHEGLVADLDAQPVPDNPPFF